MLLWLPSCYSVAGGLVTRRLTRAGTTAAVQVLQQQEEGPVAAAVAAAMAGRAMQQQTALHWCQTQQSTHTERWESCKRLTARQQCKESAPCRGQPCLSLVHSLMVVCHPCIDALIAVATDAMKQMRVLLQPADTHLHPASQPSSPRAKEQCTTNQAYNAVKHMTQALSVWQSSVLSCCMCECECGVRLWRCSQPSPLVPCAVLYD